MSTSLVVQQVKKLMMSACIHDIGEFIVLLGEAQDVLVVLLDLYLQLCKSQELPDQM
jgi:hypothetical protein